MDKRPDIKTILYTSDLGGHTYPVFHHAIASAKQNDAKIIMLHVVEPITDAVKAVIDTYYPKERTERTQKETMREILETMKKRLKKFYRDQSYEKEYSELVKEVIVVAGKPSEEILRVAEEEGADMIVMGKSTRKVRGIRIMGSTARRVSRMSPIPVLIVPNF
ncbi:universal stress protein [Desulforhopalus singaporensis]|uniref:Nucleotide-binding universal stress protein, UspA family n=1 Tax=Desulforhopalus singaporensis TaxID=91360 RepID=A0A1H0QLJ3_9BACT|nr:universal stress protein [Desulforhopalus singaporensis]SDP17606.1 Nucleotide-binding universal stress protein, UspA family [Desulforhopalus singaporensis]